MNVRPGAAVKAIPWDGPKAGAASPEYETPDLQNRTDGGP